MKLIIVLALLQLALCGHIYVSDTQLSYQNTGYLTSAQLYFKLENELQSGEIMKITWPFEFNGTVTATIKLPGATTNKTTGEVASTVNTDYLIVMDGQLDASQWYTLNLTAADAQTAAAQYYSTPIKMSTYSGKSGTSTENYLMYDYNNVCGFIAVASTPNQMQNVSMSVSSTTYSIPSDNDLYKNYEDSYPVYITISTTDDYDYGGIFYLTLQNGFTWDGCDYYPQSCTDADVSCTPVKTLTSKEYSCTTSSSQLTFARFPNTTKYAINKNEPIKLKTTVKNPGRKVESILNVQLVSHYSKLIYEYYETQTVLKTKLIALNQENALYFWKLSFDEAAKTGCPVRIYTSTDVAVWNKIWLPFKPNQTLPSSTQGFKLQASATTAAFINDHSIYIDATAFSSSTINCYSLSGPPAYVECLNLGQIQANQTKYLRFAFTIHTTDFVENDSNFGKMQILFMDDGAAVTDSKAPSKIQLSEARKSVKYSLTDNNVVSKASTTTATEAYTSGTTKFRSSIILTSGSSDLIDLVFQLSTDLTLQCCGGATITNLDCESASNTNCADQTAAAPTRLLEEQSFSNRMLVAHAVPSLIVKIIANPNALSISKKDESDSDNIYNGVEVIEGLNDGTDDQSGTFGVTFGKGVHYYSDPSTDKGAICSSNADPSSEANAKYVKYNTALTSTTFGEQYLYNQWHYADNKYELHLVCYPGALTADICGGFANTIEKEAYRGVIMKDVSVSITANPLYPSEKEIDFIMCLRYTETDNLKITQDTDLASSSLINAQVIYLNQFLPTTSIDDRTIFRIGILNYYGDDGSGNNQDYNYVPTLLRVGGYMQEDDIKDNLGIAFFFDGSNIVINSQELSTAFPLLPTECASTGTTNPTCKYYCSRDCDTTDITSLHQDYYPGLNAITISGKVDTKTEFNYYIPVKIKASAFEYAFIGLLSKLSPPEASIVYKLYGTEEANRFAKATTNEIPVGTTIWGTTGSPADEEKLVKGADWESTASTTAYGTIHPYVADGVTKTGDCFSQTGNPKPESTADSAQIDATIAGLTDEFNDDSANLLNASFSFQASAHFTVHSSIKFWSTGYNWTFTSTKIFSGACADMTITSFYEEDYNATSYLIVCPYEGTLDDSDTMESTAQIKELTWTWPDYFGLSQPIGSYLRYLWTGKLGNLRAYLAEGKTGNAFTTCTQNDLKVYALSTTQKKNTITITPQSSLKLLKSGDKAKMTIILETADATTNDETTTKCDSGIDTVQCSFTAASKIYTFTLTNIDDDEQTIPKSIILTFWMNSGATTTSNSTYKTTIKGYSYDNYPKQTDTRTVTLMECSESAIWGYNDLITRTLDVYELTTETNIANARGYFSFKFSSSNEILDESKFIIDLSLLSSANSAPTENVRCFIYIDNKISHDFALFDYSSLSEITLEYKKKYSTLAKPYSFSSISYEFKCTGAKMPETITTGAKIHVQNQISTTMMLEGYSEDQSTKVFTSLTTSVATISMAKMFDSIGQDATYTFTVTTKEVADSPSTIQFKAGSYLYVEFARDISPRFNKLGIIRCYQESEPTYCSYESERRIAFIARSDLNYNKTYGHNFTIVGVSQPAELPNNKVMYFALVPYLGTIKTLEFQDNSTNTDSILTSSSTINNLPVTHYEQSTTEIRSTFSFTMNIKFPINSIQENLPIWVDLPEEFDEATFLDWTPNCKLQNIKVEENETIDNYVSSSSMNSTRRIKIIMKNATYTSQKLFQLQVSSIPTYNYEQSNVNAPLVWFGSSESPQVPLYKTNLGNFNGTYNLATFAYSESSHKLMTWKSTTVTCKIGTYQCSASLVPQKFDRFYLDLDEITSSGSHASYFSFNPSKISVTTGKTETQFEIAPKASAAPGLYQLKWTHEASSSYYVIPPLFIVALNSQMTPATDQSTYDVPDGGKTLPIMFEFKGMMPETDVTLTGVAETLSTTTSKYVTSDDIYFVSQSQTLTYSESSEQTQIQFVVKGKKGTSNDTDLPTARISWTVSGTNSKAYATPSTNTISVVEAPVGTPDLTLYTPDSTLVGYQTFGAQCSHVGVLYYVISQDQVKTQIEYTLIQSATETKNIKETEIGTVYDNPSRTLYGYHSVTTANIDNSIKIENKFQSQAKYFMRMFCVNLVETVSEAKEVSWTQASNNGKPMITTMQFTDSNTTASNQTTYIQLNDTERKEITCVICQETQIEKERVFATNGVACGETGVVSSENTTTNTTTRILLVENATSEYFIVMPDLFVIDGSLDDAKTTIESEAFQTTLSASPILSQVKLQSISCSINSAYPALPYISSPSVSPAESSITFTWTGANNTDGFVFVGVVETLNGTVTPTELQLKKNSGYTFTGFNKAFYNKDTSVAVSVTQLTKCSDYSYYWVATNEDANTYQYTTGIKSGTTKTIGCPTFALSLAMKMLSLLVLLALLM